jgi:Mrp family chromosome partitioning ATPase
MEIIARALQRARAATPFDIAGRPLLDIPSDRSGLRDTQERLLDQSSSIALSSPDLLTERIVAYDSNHRITRSYDVLRNQLQTLAEGNCPTVIAVTAPTSGCGTTTTAANLAFSFARIRGISVLLVDANLRAPSLRSTLRLSATASPRGQEQELSLAEVDGLQLHVFCPHYEIGRVPGKSDIAQLSRQIEAIRRTLNPSVTILDLPPMLVADEAASLASNAEAVVLLLAVGHSKLSELEVCKSYLGSKSDVQVVLNRCGKHGL